jgi:hypothetical protein
MTLVFKTSSSYELSEHSRPRVDTVDNRRMKNEGAGCYKVA